MDTSIKKRVAWIDCSRLFAIILVVQCHTTVQFQNDLFPPQAAALALFFSFAGYFTRISTLSQCLKKVAPLWAALVFWSTLRLACDGRLFQGLQFYHCFIGTKHLWFIRDIIICCFFSLLYKKLPQVGKILILAVIFSYLTYFKKHLWWGEQFYSVFFFFLGNTLNTIKVSQLHHVLQLDKNRLIGAPIAFAGVIGIFYFAIYGYPFVISPLTYMVEVWSILYFCYLLEEKFPLFAATLASFGPSVIFIYLSHILFYKGLISISLRILEWETVLSPYYIWAIIAAIIIGGRFIYKILLGRNKWFDSFIFGR